MLRSLRASGLTGKCLVAGNCAGIYSTKLSMEKDLYGIQRSWEGVSVAVPQTRDGRGAECCGMNERT